MARKEAKKAASAPSVIYPEGCEPIDPDTNNSTLVVGLKALYERLSEDETATEDNFESLATLLVSSQLMNKPADVSVYVALCIARIFCICPNNPYELRNAELRDALEFLARSLGRIRCESEALHSRYHSLLEMISSNGILQQNLKYLDSETDDGARVIAALLKSAALVVEVRKAEERVQDETNELEFERKSGVRTMLQNICRGVLEENADHVHPIALDVIFSHLISPEKVNNPEAYHFMRKLCEHGAMYIHRRICNIFVNACQTQDDPTLDTNVFKLVGKRKAAVYELLAELSDVLPDIRSDLLTLLSTKLISSDTEVRLMALKTAVEVAKNRFDLAESCSSLWLSLVHRFKDTSPLVRKEFAERIKDLLYSNHDMRSTLWDCLDKLVVDLDEDVRMAAIETVCQTARKKLEAVNEKLIESCTGRLRDRKMEVRKASLKHLLALYKDVVKKEESTKSDRASVAIIAKMVILGYKGPTMTDERVIVEKGLINSLLPMELPMRRRMELLVEMSTRLSAYEIKVLHELLQRVVVGRRLLSTMVDCIAVKRNEEPRLEKSQEEKRKLIEQCIEKLVKFFPHTHKAEAALRKFTNLLCVDSEAVRQMEVILGKETTVLEAQAAVKQLLSRVGGARDEMSKEQEEMIRSLLSRLAPLLIDHSSLLELSRHMSEIIDGESIGKEEASRVINRAVSIYKVLAELYPSNLNQREIIDILLTKFLESHNDFVVKSGLQCIHAMLLKEAGVDGVNIREERWWEPMKAALLLQIKEGKPTCAKHALRDLCHMLGKAESWELLKEHLEWLLDNLDHTEDSTARSLVVLRKAVPAWKEYLLDKMVEIYPVQIARKILIPDPLVYDGGETRGVNASEMKTLEETPVSPCMRNTLAAVKMAVRLLPLFPPSDHSTALILKTINVLSVCAAVKGMVADELTECDAAWLSALSGSGLVRLMTDRRIAKNTHFFKPSVMVALAQVATHPLETVRLYFINRVYKYHRGALLVAPFLSLIPLSLMAFCRADGDKEEEERKRRTVTDLLAAGVQSRYSSLMGKNVDDVMIRSECFVPYLVFLLADSPTLNDNDDEEELTRIAEVLWHCVEALVRVRGSVNWDLVCALLNQLKTVYPNTDNLHQSFSNPTEVDQVELARKVWAISEIMLHLIVYKAKIATQNAEKSAPLLRTFFEPIKGDNNVVYAPTALLKSIEGGKIQHEFHKLKISSSMVKDETKREKGRGRGRRKAVKKREESDEEMEEAEEEMPSTSQRALPMETVQEEEEEMEMEEKEEEEKEEKGVKKRVSQRGKPPVNRRLTSMRELESIDLSPIGGGGGRRGGMGRGLAASTPIVRNGMGGKGEVEQTKETTPKKRGRGSQPTMSVNVPAKSPSKSPIKSPVKSPPKLGSQNGMRKRSSKKEEENEEEEGEEEKPLPAKRGRGRAPPKKENGKELPKRQPSDSTKGRGKKKVEEEEEEEKEEEREEEKEKEEEAEKEEEQQTLPRRGRAASMKKAPPPVRKTSSRKKK